MLFSKYVATWDKITAENSFHKRAGILQSVAICALSLVLLFKGHTTILIPPVPFTGQAEISSHSADSNYKKTWGMFMAELMGNLTPDSIEYVKKSLGTFLSPDLYNRLHESIEKQSDEIKEQRIAVSFSPKQVMFESDSNKVFVTGTSTTTGVSSNAQPSRVDRTYEFVITVNGNLPSVSDFDVYRGEPHTLDWIARNPGLAKQQAAGSQEVKP